MADEDDDDGEKKKKSPLLKIILIVLVVLILLVGAVVGTLFFTGFFDAKPAEEKVEETLEQAADVPQLKPAGGGDAQSGDAAKDGGKVAPQPRVRPTPDPVRFEQTYLELQRPLLANLTNSRKVMQVTVAIMTHYDDRVIRNVQKHEFSIRSGLLDLMRQVTEADTLKPEFRKDLAERMRIEMNALLEKYTGFGGIEEIHFTEFVVQ